ncbi:hypothetical protein VKT23_015119 [Stygiomarasmius scandens]|uniref:Fungal STAND N-terminal Goodbye domain-containing protein n=1 Tax=Marasmiellus scandens TaxID=2682957 RepID=A0ABR1J1H0_9AGAR
MDAVAEAIASLSVPGGKAVFVAVGVSLKTTQGMSDRFDMLIDLFDTLAHSLERLEARKDITFTRHSRAITLDILIALLDVLALATKTMKQNWAKHFVKTIIGKDSIAEAFKRLVRLVEEHRAIAVETFARANSIYSLIESVRHTQQENGRTLRGLIDSQQQEIRGLREQIYSLPEKIRIAGLQDNPVSC